MNFSDYLSSLSPENAAAVGAFFNFPGTGGPPAPPSSDPYAPGAYNPYAGINPSRYSGVSRKKFPADQLYADLIRAQTQDYLRRFAPIENMLAGSITPTGTTFITQDLENTRQAFGGATENIRGQIGRQNERLGITNAQPSGFENQAVGAMVGGINDTYARDQDRKMALLTGGLGALSQNVRQVRG